MEQPKSRRGFAGMSPERLTEVVSLGGRTAAAGGKGHRWTREEAIAAGKLGGALVAQRAGHMSRLGVAGGKANAIKRAAKKSTEGAH